MVCFASKMFYVKGNNMDESGYDVFRCKSDSIVGLTLLVKAIMFKTHKIYKHDVWFSRHKYIIHSLGILYNIIVCIHTSNGS